jgi:altronate dehydratase
VNPALVISARDNVATALEPLDAGATIAAGPDTVTLVDAIPRGHKLALRTIRIGEAIVKYGSPIGTAARDIAAGAHVHTHNVVSGRGRGDLESRRSANSALRIAEPPDLDA